MVFASWRTRFDHVKHYRVEYWNGGITSGAWSSSSASEREKVVKKKVVPFVLGGAHEKLKWKKERKKRMNDVWTTSFVGDWLYEGVTNKDKKAECMRPLDAAIWGCSLNDKISNLVTDVTDGRKYRRTETFLWNVHRDAWSYLKNHATISFRVFPGVIARSRYFRIKRDDALSVEGTCTRTGVHARVMGGIIHTK